MSPEAQLNLNERVVRLLGMTPMALSLAGAYWDDAEGRTRVLRFSPTHRRRGELGLKSDDRLIFDVIRNEEDLARAEAAVGISTPSLEERVSVLAAAMERISQKAT